MSTAVDRAVAVAKESPIVSVFIRNSGHLGALGQFVVDLAEAGMVAFLCQETPVLMALPGSTGPAIGNNPLAFAAPLSGQAPIVFDMATSVVARGNVLQAIRDNADSIPDHWAIGPDGQPTTLPSVALKGAMRPVADHKGIWVAMMIQVLAGSLTASATAASASKHGATSSAGNVSAFLSVFNPDLLIGRAAFDAHMQAWMTHYLDASGKAARYPGQRAADVERSRRELGIPISDSVLNDLRRVGELVNEPFELKAIK